VRAAVVKTVERISQGTFEKRWRRAHARFCEGHQMRGADELTRVSRDYPLRGATA